MAKPIPGQLNVPVPNEIGSRHNPDLVYEQMFGSERANRQRELHEESSACNCGRKRSPHAAGCPKAKRLR